MSDDGGSAGRAQILLVEDSEADIRLTREALRDSKVRTTLHVVHNGVDALRFLRREEEYSYAPVPDVVLLDLNMPRMDGRELLEIVKRDSSLSRIPIVVLTTSDEEEDVVKSYSLQANCYIRKPLDMGSFITVVKRIEDFWFEIVKLPPNPGEAGE